MMLLPDVVITVVDGRLDYIIAVNEVLLILRSCCYC